MLAGDEHNGEMRFKTFTSISDVWFLARLDLRQHLRWWCYFSKHLTKNTPF